MHTDGVTVFSQWPVQHFFDYIFSFDSIVSNLQYSRECQGELWIIVRGDGLPCGGESWCQMSISFANYGHLARTLSYHWTVNVALCGEKSTSVLSEVWQLLQQANKHQLLSQNQLSMVGSEIGGMERIHCKQCTHTYMLLCTHTCGKFLCMMSLLFLPIPFVVLSKNC